MKTQNYFLVLTVFFALSHPLFVSAAPTPGHDASSVGPGTFSGSSSDTWSFPGKVGIGTTSPGHTLDVSGGNIRASGEIISTLSSGYGQARYIAGNYGVFHRNDGSNYYILLTASGDQYGSWNSLRPFRINDASGEVYLGNGALYVQHAGNVGIGTTAPAEDFHVYRGDSDVARIYATGSSQGAGMFYAGQSTSYGGGVAYDGDNSPDIVGGADRITFFRRSGGADTEVFSYPYNSDNVYFAGNIGIGTSAPSYGLHIYRDGWKARFSGSDGYIDIGPANSGWAHIYTDRPSFIFNKDLWSITGGFSAYSTANLYLQTNGNTQMTILNSNGNVGIGTTSPGEKLQVAGNVKVTGSRIKNSAGYGIVQTDATDWLRINPDSNYPAIALYKPVAIGTGGLAVGEWSQQSSGVLKVTQSAYLATSGGNVGVGTTNPQAKLDVNGKIKLQVDTTTYSSTGDQGPECYKFSKSDCNANTRGSLFVGRASGAGDQDSLCVCLLVSGSYYWYCFNP